MPWKQLLAHVTGAIDEELRFRNEYLVTENQIFRSKIAGRIVFKDEERRELAAIGKQLGRKALEAIATIVKPATILRWHADLIARKFDGSLYRRPPGRPPVSTEVEKLILRFARENRTWGYNRISGALKNLGHRVSDTTVGNVLRKHGLPPVCERKEEATWREIIRNHMDVLVATDFKESMLIQNSCKYLIHDRDSKFCEHFDRLLRSVNIEPVKLPPRSPNLNANAERFILSVKSECLDQMILFGERSLRHVLKEYTVHYHQERHHQGIGNNIIVPQPAPEISSEGKVECRERLGDLLKFYHRRVA